ncbi:isoprenylcysteine carboxylmethyltransferase family protein [Phycicoccus endophyticus]|uniref:Isoprenylcysteine carboxylmethyltransferase family protein n=1 Tax=Phycicoccus endophyticus TaxID=1690220 RepID=A0A7G9R2Q6_9MICO|nr:methyltransferase [Phycicoccus endophyticus]NHI20348.1 isoprenylcysteine carboxylmethyltransferase family protein [Phycicoccus endophyticus]QNN49881.1 isoprenylcysteine carboxylmethyltransferase family protein [Phycicoccus endophyticus]GGL29944.1 hypothetical protein GCM10012283_10410 [Phycicoccus endophyticus]
MSVALLRNLTLVVPLLAVVGAGAARARVGGLRPRVPAAALATGLAWVGLVAVEAGGGWWLFPEGPTTVLGVPVETSLGWALTWGALPVLAGGHVGLWWCGFLWADVLVVPRLDPLVHLGPRWLVGELVLLLLVAAPALALGSLTVTRRALPARVALQGVTFVGLLGWAAPTLALDRNGLGWPDVLDHGLAVRVLLLAAAVVLAVPPLAAVAELWRVGRGTPFPWDPPDRLVVSGPYAYLHNPMQAGAVGLLVLLAAAAGSVTLLLGVVFAGLFSVAVAEPHERGSLTARWPGYRGYRTRVRGWCPHWRPAVAPPATLWVSRTCGLCASTGTAVLLARPSGVVVRAAEDAPVRLTRMRWQGVGTCERGVAALARSLERVSLPWAWVGWALRLPGVDLLVQVAADACGLGPRELPDRAGTVTP